MIDFMSTFFIIYIEYSSIASVTYKTIEKKEAMKNVI